MTFYIVKVIIININAITQIVSFRFVIEFDLLTKILGMNGI